MVCMNKHPCGSRLDIHCSACRIEGMNCCQCGKPITELMGCE